MSDGMVFENQRCSVNLNTDFVKFMLIIPIGLKDLANSLYFITNYKNYCTQKGYKTKFPILKIRF